MLVFGVWPTTANAASSRSPTKASNCNVVSEMSEGVLIYAKETTLQQGVAAHKKNYGLDIFQSCTYFAKFPHKCSLVVITAVKLNAKVTFKSNSKIITFLRKTLTSI